MKKKNLFALALMLMAAAMLTFTSCGKDDDDDDNNVDPIPEGIIGKWISEGEDVAPLLATFLDIVKITAEFREDGTYQVFSYTSEDVETIFTGVYTQTKTTFGEIWEITLEQSVPTAVTSEGIFEVIVPESGPRTMRYEVVQTNPALGTAPTAQEGFGSSSGGALGNSNIQKYVEILD